MTRTASAARRESHCTIATRQKHHPEATGVRGSVYRKRQNPKSGGSIDRRLEKEFTGRPIQLAWSSLVVQDLSTLGGIPPKVIRARAMSSTKGSNAIELFRLRSISSLVSGS